MAFNPLAGLASAHVTKFLKGAASLYSHELSVLELGNQRFRLTNPVIKSISDLLEVGFKLPATDPEFSDFTPSFFRQMGYHEYHALDMNDKMEAIPVDLK